MVGYLVLENGDIYEGERIGFHKDAIFEIVFNTSMSGYMETLTDPSYVGQGIVFTYPLIGNYGVIKDDVESTKIWLSAVLVHELAEYSSNFRKENNLNDFLIENETPGLQHINTRKLTKTIREFGTMRAKIVSSIENKDAIIKELKNYQFNKHTDLVSLPRKSLGNGKYKIALMDFGVKQNIVKSLLNYDVNITFFQKNSSFEEIMKIKPDGIILSNGPGDPKDNVKAIQTIKKLYESNIPILGICLGHQLLALSVGFDTKKLKYGHRGPNHPVKYYKNQRIYMTSQNHGYYIDEATVSPSIATILYRNVNDKTIEGLKYNNKKIVTVQFHPEACAGPHDTAFIFDDFLEIIKKETHA